MNLSKVSGVVAAAARCEGDYLQFTNLALRSPFYWSAAALCCQIKLNPWIMKCFKYAFSTTNWIQEMLCSRCVSLFMCTKGQEMGQSHFLPPDTSMNTTQSHSTNQRTSWEVQQCWSCCMNLGFNLQHLDPSGTGSSACQVALQIELFLVGW